MKHLVNIRLIGALVVALGLLIVSPQAAFAESWRSDVETWEELEERRAAVGQRLQSLERAHQNSVSTIEGLREDQRRGQGTRRELDSSLRDNLRVVEALEEVQRELNDLSREQERLRGWILAGIEEERERKEREIREVSAARRIELTVELNQLLQTRRRFAAPLPQADRERVAAALQVATMVREGHPREMLSVADELEDTEEQLLRRLAGVNQRITELERTRQLQRRGQAFAETESFFDEESRSRMIARFEQTVEVPRQPGERSGSGDSEGAADDAEEAHAAPEMDFAEDEASFEGPSAPDPAVGDPEVIQDESEMPAEDPFSPEPETRTERVVIESQVDPDRMGISYFSEGAVERDLQRLRRERQELEGQAEELREKARELRQRANQD